MGDHSLTLWGDLPPFLWRPKDYFEPHHDVSQNSDGFGAKL